MRHLVLLVLAMMSCRPAPAGWSIQGELIGMEVRPAPKHAVGGSAGQVLVVQVEPRVVTQGGAPLSEADWTEALLEHQRRDNGIWEFETPRAPFPTMLPPGTEVQITLGHDEYVQTIMAVP